MTAKPAIKGHCPGALRPMEANDGLLVRVRPRLSRLSRAQLAAIAEAAAAFGDGSLTLTSRANVQIRGVAPAGHARALALLAGAGLLDEDAALEAVRNIVVAPDIALGTRADTVAARGIALAQALAGKLRTSPRLRELPGKFGVSVMSGDRWDGTVISDVTFLLGETDVRMVLAGEPHRCERFADTDAAAATFEAVATAFLQLRTAHPKVRRLREAVALLGADAFACAAREEQIEPRLAAPMPFVGFRQGMFGIGFAFGELRADSVQSVLAFMSRHGIGEAAVSPGRALVFSCADADEAEFRELARTVGGIFDPSDVRLRLHACRGAPACSAGETASRRDAHRLLTAFNGVGGFAGAIHISGCAKRCAYPGDAEIAAIGASGAYTILVRGSVMAAGVEPQSLPQAIATCLEEFP